MKHWFSQNLVIKLVALGLAVITWYYVNGELLK